MKPLRLLHIALCAFVGTCGFAQSSLQISEQVHNLGNITWQEPINVVFRVKNISQKNVLIDQLRTDCGCTLASTSATEILPGREALITAHYDAAMLGHFTKRVSFRASTEPEPVILTLTGRVVLDAQGKAEVYPFRIGDVSLNADIIEFDDVYRGETPIQTIRLYNAGQQTIEPELLHLPKYLQATASPKKIYPGRNGVIDIVLDPKELAHYGLTQTQVYLGTYPGERISRDNEIGVSVTLLPTSALAISESGQTPKLQLSEKVVKFSALVGKKKQKAEVLLTNTGTATLNIEALQVYNPGISVRIDSQKIEPGKSAKVKITVSKLVESFKGRTRILLLTNDPSCPKATIDLQIAP